MKRPYRAPALKPWSPRILLTLLLPLAALAEQWIDVGSAHRMTVPDGYRVGRPPNAPKILIQADAPAGDCSIQVIRENPASPENLAGSYEASMRAGLGSLERVDEGRLEIEGRPILIRRYAAASGSTHIVVLASFQQIAGDGFVTHALFESGDGAALIPHLISLGLKATKPPIARENDRPPSKGNAPEAPKAPASVEEAYQGLVVEDSGFEFQLPKRFDRFQASEGQSQWADPAEKAPRPVLVIQTLARSEGNTLESVTDKLLRQVKGSDAATLVESAALEAGGLPAHRLHFTLRQSGGLSHFLYLILDLPGPNVATLSYVGPHARLAELRAHFRRMLESVKTRSSASAPKAVEKSAAVAAEMETQGPTPALKVRLADARAREAAALRASGATEDAVALLASSLRLRPGVPERLEWMGDWLDTLPQPAASHLAQSYYEEALAIEPARRNCRVKLAASHLAKGEFSEAAAHYERLVSPQQGSVDLEHAQDLALCYLALGEAERGAEFFATCASERPAPPVLLLLAIFLERAGMPEDAAKIAEEAAQLLPAGPQAELARALGERIRARRVQS